MRSIKVGYLPLYVKLYDDMHTDRAPLVSYMEKLIRMLGEQGLEVVPADEICRVREEFERAVAKFNALGVDAVVTQHLAYSPSLESIDALLKLEAPIIVFDTTPDCALISRADSYNGIGNNHGIHGVQDMCSVLKRRGRPYEICAGHVLCGDVVSRLAERCRAAAMCRFFRQERVGSLGGVFPGMGDFQITDEEYRREIGAEVVRMTPDQAETYLSAVTEDEIDRELLSDHQNYNTVAAPSEDYRAATRSGLAVRKWMEAERLGACTINFLSLDRYGMPKMPFTECCKLMARGQGYAGEGDTLTAGLVGALLSQYPDTTFAEMFCPDWEQDVILLSHMAEGNPRLAQWKPVIADKGFRFNSCGNTVGMFLCFRPGKAVLINLAPAAEGFTLIVSGVEMLDAGLENGAYRRAIQGWLKPAKPLTEFLEAYSLAGGTHHSALVYGADLRTIKAFGRMMGFRVAEI